MRCATVMHRFTSALVAALLVALVVPVAPASGAELPTDYTQQKLTAPDMAKFARLGAAVAVWGDTAVVGAPDDDELGVEAGSAYVYVRRGGAWAFVQKLTAASGAAYNHFGRSVAIHADTIVVGASGYKDSAGAAHVFTRDAAGVWGERERIRAGTLGIDDRFGYSVAVDGGTILVGAVGDDELADSAGAVYVFTGGGDTWTEGPKLMADDAVASAIFGSSVALDGGTALIAAEEDDVARGAVYVFTGSGSTWSQRAKLTPDDTSSFDYFGSSVALDRGTALVGARNDDTARGAAYVFTGSGASWTQRKKLVASDRMVMAYFGRSVALSGGAALVGAYGYDTNTGRAYVFTGNGGTWTERTWLAASDAATNDQFGRAVALSGGNGVIGAPQDTTGEFTIAGSAYFHAFSTQFTPGTTRIAGSNRYLTALAASRQGFPAGAPAVVVATGENWPDALGGSALAGAAHGPLLLTRKDALPAEVTAEVKRLGAVRAYVLGSTASVSATVEDALVGMLGRRYVVRLGGPDRYATARLVADETIRLRGATYPGGAFVATGLNYPDATAASPLAAHMGVPILLANIRAGTVSVPPSVRAAVVLGSEAAVPESVYDYLVARLGVGKVTRIGGANRYATAVMIAEAATSGDMKWNGVGLATGENFPDALAAGPMLAAVRKSVLLLTRPAALPGETQVVLHSNRSSISTMFIFGDTNAVSTTVEAAAAAAAGL